ncbi:MAG: GGDEF domain-containing protein, partial [Sphingomonas sp.]
LLMLQRKMRDLANTDPLTGLLNRRALDARLQQEIAAAGPETCFSVALVDLDGFKPVNDCHGHAAGDVLLCEVGERLRGAGGDDAVVARLGGDEFAILVPCGSAIATHAIAGHMLSALVPPHQICGHDIRIGASIGVATWPVDGRTADALFDTADRALYVAKAESRHPRRGAETGRSVAA